MKRETRQAKLERMLAEALDYLCDTEESARLQGITSIRRSELITKIDNLLCPSDGLLCWGARRHIAAKLAEAHRGKE